MHIIRIASYGLLTIGAIIGVGIAVVFGLALFTGKIDAFFKSASSTSGIRIGLGVFISIVCVASANSILTYKASDVSSSAISVALLALLGFAVDFYSHGKIYLTGDFGPVSSAMLLCACLLAAASDDYKRHKQELQQ